MKATLVICLLATPGVARAQATDRAASAEAAFQEASRLMAEGKTAEACPKFAVSHELDPGYGAIYNLGVCYKALGKTASAWAAFREAEQLARKLRETEREIKARTRAAELLPQLVKLRVVVPSATPGLVIQRDDLVLEPALWDLEIPVDPGEHTLTASAPGKQKWTTTVTLGKPGESVVVDVPQLRDAVSPKGEKPAGGAAVPERQSGLGPQKIVAIGAAGLGVAGLAVGAAFGGMALSKWGEARDGHCDSRNVCDERGVALHGDAMTMAHVSTAGFAVGGAGIAAAVVLWLTAPAARDEAPRSGATRNERTGLSGVTPLVGTNGGGLSFTGSF